MIFMSVVLPVNSVLLPILYLSFFFLLQLMFLFFMPCPLLLRLIPSFASSFFLFFFFTFNNLCFVMSVFLYCVYGVIIIYNYVYKVD